MRTLTFTMLAAAALTLAAAPVAGAQDTARAIAGGGVHVAGWTG